MCLRNLTVFAIVLTLASLTTCQSNSTEFIDDVENSTVTQYNSEEEHPQISKVWCPNQYESIWLSGSDEITTCRPLPCLWPPETNGSLVVNNFTQDANHTRQSICAVDDRFDRSFALESCQFVRLIIDDDDFRINYTDGSMYELETNSTYQLKDYFYRQDTGEAVICRNKTRPNDDTDDVVMSCQSHRLNVTEYEIHPNETLYLPSLHRTVRKGYYNIGQLDTQWAVIDICLRSSKKMNCEIFDIPAEDLKVLPDLSLWTNFGDVVVIYPQGEYFMSAEQRFASVCIDSGSQTRDETRYLYATAYVISSIFAFLTLLVHLVYPHLNYHAKALLCHIISLLVMYIAMALRTFIVDFASDAGRLILFGIQYVSALATFLWLNVLAYELWRVFADLPGNPGTLGPQKGKKRWFILKCVYAWGIPLVLCFLVIGLSYDTKASEYLDLTLSSGGAWFMSDQSMLNYFYVPIIIILLENLIFFGLTVWNIRRASRGTNIINKKVSRQLLRVFVKLFVVMGIFWFAELISWLLRDKADESVWYATDLINALQGVAIFLVYVCKRSTLKLIKKKLTGKRTEGSNSSKSTSSTPADKSRKTSVVSPQAIAMVNIKPIPQVQSSGDV